MKINQSLSDPMKTKHQDPRPKTRDTKPIEPRPGSLEYKLRHNKRFGPLVSSIVKSPEKLRAVARAVDNEDSRVQEKALWILHQAAKKGADFSPVFQEFKRILSGRHNSFRCEMEIWGLVDGLAEFNGTNVSEMIPATLEASLQHGIFGHILSHSVRRILRVSAMQGIDLRGITEQFLIRAEAEDGWQGGWRSWEKEDALYLLGSYKWPEQYAERARNVLLNALNSSDEGLHRKGIDAWKYLAACGADISTAMPFLLKFLEGHLDEKDEWKRFAAAQAFAYAAENGQDISIAIPGLISIITKDKEIKDKAIQNTLVKGLQAAVIDERTRDKVLSELSNAVNGLQPRADPTAILEVLSHAADNNIDIWQFVPFLFLFAFNASKDSKKSILMAFSGAVKQGQSEKIASYFAEAVANADKKEPEYMGRFTSDFTAYTNYFLLLQEMAVEHDKYLDQLVVAVIRKIIDSPWFMTECGLNSKCYCRMIDYISDVLSKMKELEGNQGKKANGEL